MTAGDPAAVETAALVLGGGLAGHRAAIPARETGVAVDRLYVGAGASPGVIW